MDGRRMLITASAIAATLAVAAVAQTGVAGGAPVTYSIDAAAFAHRPDTTHVVVCTNGFTLWEGEERRGLVLNSGGGSIASVNLPQGVTVDRLQYAFRDNEADFDSHAYLLRKRLEPDPNVSAFDGYLVMAEVHSNGASTPLRRRIDATVVGGTVNNARYAYFAEIVNCGGTIEPAGVQVVYFR